MSAGPENRTELSLEELAIMEAEPNGTQTQGRVCLLDFGVPGGQLFGTDVEGSHGNPLRRHEFGEFPVIVVKRLFVGEIQPVHEKELGAIESNPVGTIILRRHHLFQKFDVCLNCDEATVEGAGRKRCNSANGPDV